MNIKVKTFGGGPFSLLTVALQCINYDYKNNLDKIENIYLDIDKTSINPFNYVLEQSSEMSFDSIINCHETHQRRLKNDINASLTYTDLFNHPDLINLKKIIKKLKIKNKVSDKLTIFNDKTLGVHIRLTDMNNVHPEHGKFTIDNYISKIKTVLDSDPTLNSIFIASDNDESITKITSLFSDHKITWNNVSNRSLKENNSAYINYQFKSLSNEMFWIDSFLEMLSLSLCDELIQRVSNLSHSSLIFSEKIKKIHKL
jgi:hypothetical protein